jgi:hypothetical protein
MNKFITMLVTFEGLERFRYSGPSKRGFGQRSWLLPPEHFLVVSEPESIRLLFTGR